MQIEEDVLALLLFMIQKSGDHRFWDVANPSYTVGSTSRRTIRSQISASHSIPKKISDLTPAEISRNLTALCTQLHQHVCEKKDIDTTVVKVLPSSLVLFRSTFALGGSCMVR